MGNVIHWGDPVELEIVTAEQLVELEGMKHHPSTAVEGVKKDWSVLSNPMANEAAQQIQAIKEIDPRKYFCRTTDEKGHYTEARVKYPTYQAGPMAYVIERVPAYRSVADLFRDAVVKQMRWLCLNMEEIDPQPLCKFFSMVDSDRDAQEALDNASAVQKLVKMIRVHSELGAWESLAQALERQRAHASGMPEPFKSRMIRKIDWGQMVLEKRKKLKAEANKRGKRERR